MFLLDKFLKELSLFLGVLLAQNRQQVLSTLWHWRLDCLWVMTMMMMVMMMVMMMMMILRKTAYISPCLTLQSCSTQAPNRLPDCLDRLFPPLSLSVSFGDGLSVLALQGILYCAFFDIYFVYIFCLNCKSPSQCFF